MLFCLSSGYSLRLWEDKGMIMRELDIIRKFSKDFELTLFSYGEQQKEESIAAKYHLDIRIYAINSESRWQILSSILHAIKIGLTIKFNVLRSIQFSGSWVCFVVSLFNKSFYTIRSGYNYYTHVVVKSNNFFFKFIYRIFERLNLMRSNLVICTANEQVNYYQGKLKSVNVMKLHNHVDLGVFRPSMVKDKKQYEFIIVSKFTEQKNLVNTILFLKTFEKPTLLIGKGNNSELSSKLLNLISENANWLYYESTIANQELPSYFRRSNYYVNFSLYEGNPKAVIEAYCSGMLLLLSDIPAHRELKSIFRDRAILLDLKSVSSSHTFTMDSFSMFFNGSDMNIVDVDSFDLDKSYQREILHYKTTVS